MCVCACACVCVCVCVCACVCVLGGFGRRYRIFLAPMARGVCRDPVSYQRQASGGGGWGAGKGGDRWC